jgi:hypothetical protein
MRKIGKCTRYRLPVPFITSHVFLCFRVIDWPLTNCESVEIGVVAIVSVRGYRYGDKPSHDANYERQFGARLLINMSVQRRSSAKTKTYIM